MNDIILPNLGIVPPFQPGTIKPEEDYKQFEALGAKLGLPCPQVHITLRSTDADGNVVAEFSDRSRTFNRNYWNMLFKIMGGMVGSATTSLADSLLPGTPTSSTTWGAGHLTQKSTTAVVRNSNASFPPPTASPAVGNVLSGIVVGTGSSAEDFEGHALTTPVAQGTGAGQLSYAAMTLSTPSYNAGTKVWTSAHARIINNNSGGTITVTETAMYAHNINVASGVAYMIMRDLLGASVAVLNAGQLTVTYTFTLTFPA